MGKLVGGYRPPLPLAQRATVGLPPLPLVPGARRLLSTGMSLILASASPIRAALLRRACLAFEVVPAAVDEPALRRALGPAEPPAVALALAEAKARAVAAGRPGGLVLGCDQVLDLDGEILAKPGSVDAARTQLLRLRGRSHRLFSAVVLYRGARPVWRHVGEARLTMRSFSDAWLDSYLAQNGAGVADSVGAYKIEEAGIRLFERIEGEHSVILGLPLVELLAELVVLREIAG